MSFALACWLWIVLILLALLALNTLLCSSETLWSRRGRGGWPALFAPQCMHAGFLLIVLAPDITKPAERVVISPNHPWFRDGFGVYIKQAEAYPVKRALLEIHREPGASMALAGALLFTLGNIMLVAVRSKQREDAV